MLFGECRDENIYYVDDFVLCESQIVIMVA